jgi:hypothetical protein
MATFGPSLRSLCHSKAKRNGTGAEVTWAEDDGATRISCTLPLDATACAAFFKESRMKCATKLHRKSGHSPTIAFAESLQIGLWIQKHSTGSIPCCYDIDSEGATLSQTCPN